MILHVSKNLGSDLHANWSKGIGELHSCVRILLDLANLVQTVARTSYDMQKTNDHSDRLLGLNFLKLCDWLFQESIQTL